MLTLIYSIALSSSALLSGDSVRASVKQGPARPDSTVRTVSVPTVGVSTQPSSVNQVANAAPMIAPVTHRVPEIVQQGAAQARGGLVVAMASRSSAFAPATSASASVGSKGVTVIGTRSSVTVEPLHAVPVPLVPIRLAPPPAADSIVVYKRERVLTLFYRGVPVRNYLVALGGNPVGDKVSAGDRRTPEGVFHVDAHNPASKYHLGLHISYPDAAHRAHSAALGVDPGGNIMIHGLPDAYSDYGRDHRQDDWTNGCVALTNQEIEEIWRAVPDGTPVQIKP